MAHGRIAVAAALVAAFACPAAAGPPEVARLEELAWLAGSWAGTQDARQMEEHWMAPRGGCMIGMHRDIADGRTSGFEFLRIEETADGIVYVASPQGRPGTAFRLVERGPGRRVVFANPQHDFPQRILYWLDAEGALYARVEGRPGGSEPAMEWRWRPASLR